MAFVVSEFSFAALVAALLTHGFISRRGINVCCQLSAIIWLMIVVVVVVVAAIVVVVVVVVGVLGSGAVGTAGASRNRVPVDVVVIVSEAVATAGAGRLTLAILLLALGVWDAFVRIEATWVVVVNELGKLGCEFGTRLKPDVCANRHVATAMSWNPVVHCFLPLAVLCDISVVV